MSVDVENRGEVASKLGVAPADWGVTAPDGSTKARIERAALTLFVARGVAGVAVREIAARVGITDAEIYRHFKSNKRGVCALHWGWKV